MEDEPAPSATPMVDAWLARWASMEELPLEGANEEEEAKLIELRAALLREQGLESPPKGWKSRFYTKVFMARFLRGCSGVVEDAKERLTASMKWFDDVDYWEDLRRHEVEDFAKCQAFLDRVGTDGIYGRDRRGAPCIYMRPGIANTPGQFEALGRKAYIAHFCAGVEIIEHTIYSASLEAGVALIGCTQIIDVAHLSYSKARSTTEVYLALTHEILKGNFPETTATVVIMNVPWYLSFGWNLLYPLLPKRTVEKMQIFSDGAWDRLVELVDPSELPPWLGGRSKVPWPYSDGGDVHVMPELPGLKGGLIGMTVDAQLRVRRVQHVEVDLPARKVCIWEWRVLRHDVGLGVEVDGRMYRKTARVGAAQSWQIDSYQSGHHNPKLVKIRLTFDNTHSYFRQKDIEYRIFFRDIPVAEQVVANHPPE